MMIENSKLGIPRTPDFEPIPLAITIAFDTKHLPTAENMLQALEEFEVPLLFDEATHPYRRIQALVSMSDKNHGMIAVSPTAYH